MDRPSFKKRSLPNRMRKIIIVLFILFIGRIDAQSKQFFTVNKDSTQFQLTPEAASHLASLPLKCIVQEYPNKINHLAIGDSDQMITPHNMHPAFYGCLDWHSSVHGHWMLVKLLKDFPALTDAKKIRELISHNISAENIMKEAKYFDAPFSKSFERTYGWAWVLKLQQELNNWNDALAKKSGLSEYFLHFIFELDFDKKHD
jgi:hypothetical protein